MPPIDVLANDSTGPGQRVDPDADGHRGDPGLPTARRRTDGTTVTYTPDADYNGTDSFTYTVCDNGTTNGVPTRSATRPP